MLRITAKVFLSNAFHAAKTQTLTMGELRRFHSVLYNKLTGNNRAGVKYKYPVFDIGNEDIDRLSEKEDRFIRGITMVVCVEPVTKDDVDEANKIYPQDVQDVLAEAREEYAK